MVVQAAVPARQEVGAVDLRAIYLTLGGYDGWSEPMCISRVGLQGPIGACGHGCDPWHRDERLVHRADWRDPQAAGQLQAKAREDG